MTDEQVIEIFTKLSSIESKLDQHLENHKVGLNLAYKLIMPAVSAVVAWFTAHHHTSH